MGEEGYLSPRQVALVERHLSPLGHLSLLYPCSKNLPVKGPYHTLNTFLDYRVDRIRSDPLRKERDRFSPGIRQRPGVKIRYWVSTMLARHGSLSALLREQQVCLFLRTHRSSPMRLLAVVLLAPPMEEGIVVCGSDQLVLVICGGGPRVGDLAALSFTGKEGLYT